MKTRFSKFFPGLFTRALLVAGAAGALAVHSAMAANCYFSLQNPSGTGYDENGNFWNTTEELLPGSAAYNEGDTMVIGTNSSDFNGSNYTINLDSGASWGAGVFIGATNVQVIFSGSANTHINGTEVWAVTNGSSLTLNMSRQDFGTAAGDIHSLNWNNHIVTFIGPGTYYFVTPFGCNSTAANTNNGAVVNLQWTNTIPTPATDAGSYKGGFTQAGGALNFAAPGAADAFYGFPSTAPFVITGGTIDNTSGTNMTLVWTGGGGMVLGGSFTFVGSSSLNLSTAAVQLVTSPTITIGSNTLTMGGVISGTGNGITVAGNGLLVLDATNTYTGATAVNGGGLVAGTGSALAAASSVSLGSAVLCGGGSIGGAVSTTSSGAQINQETNYEMSGSVGTLALGSSVNLSSGGPLSFDLGSSHVSGNDMVTVAGTLTLGGNTVHIKSLIGSGFFDGSGDYILVQGTSAPSGSINPTLVWDGTPPANSNLFMVEVVGNNVVLHFNPGTTFAVSGVSATPSSITRFQSTLLSVTVTNGTAPYTITVDTSSIGGSSSFNLVQDLNEPAGVSVFTNSIMPANTTTSGSYVLPVSATDNASDAAGSEILLTVTPLSLVWNGDASGNSPWDTTGDIEWQGGRDFAQGDTVRFDDTASEPNATNVYIQEAVTPAAVTVSNTAARATGIYEFNNNPNNPISGATSLLKQGSGTLILDQNSTYSGTTTISGGTLQLGNRDGNGALGTGPITDSGSLIFDNPGNSQVISNAISGSGSMMEEGNDNLQLAGASPLFTGSILVTSNSTLQLGAYNSLGSAVTTVITNSTLDINGYTASGSVIAQGIGTDGNGAINNRSSTTAGEAGIGGTSFVGMTNLTLSGNITLGAANGRWDLRNPGSTGGNPAVTVLSTGGQPYNIIKVGSQFIGIVAATVDTNLANIDVQNGTFDMEGNTTGLGNPTNTLTIEGTLFGSDGTFQMYAITNRLNKVIVVNDGGTLQAANGNDTIIGPVTFTNSSSSATPDCTVNVSGTTLNLAGQIYGNGILYQNIGTNTLILTGTDTNFAGSVVINEGKLVVSNILSTVGGVNVNFGSSLYVDGAIGGPGVTNNASGNVTGSGIISNVLDNFGNLDPGTPAAPATLTVGGLVFENGCSPTFNLNYNNTVGGGVNDLIAVKGNLTLIGGTATINPLSILQDGVSYTLITYTGTCNVPVGLVTSGLSINGVNNYQFAITNTGSAITITPSAGPPVWNGGGSPDNYWDDAANWNNVNLSGNDILTFGGTVGLNNTNDETSETAQSIMFLAGAGAFTLNASNGVPLTLNGNIINNSTATQTINIPLIIGGSSTSQLFSAASGPLDVIGGITNNSTSMVTIHLQGTNGVLSGPLTAAASPYCNQGITLDYVAGASNTWAITGNSTVEVLTNLTVSGGGLTIGTGSDSPTLDITNFNTESLFVGTQTNTIASLTLNSGTINISATNATAVDLGELGSTGIVNVVGGTINFSGRYFQIGDTFGKGILNVSGGTVTANCAGDFILGNQTNASGVLNVSGGTLNIPANVNVGFRGPGVWNISGNGSVVCDTTVNMTRNSSDSPNASGIVNLNGGTLIMNQESLGNAATGQTGAFNFNGGLLEAATNSTAFLSPATSPSVFTTTVDAGGAIINDGGFAITISAPLVHESSLGATPDGGLIKQGSGTNTLSGTNTYTGNTIISGGSLALSGGGSIASSAKIIIAGGATFDVSGLTTAFALGSSQVLSNSAVNAAINGTNNTGTGTLSLVYDGVHPSLVISSNGMTLSGNTALKINNTGATLAVGTYAIITNANSGYVTGTVPSSFTVSGGGVTAGQPKSLQISGGALNLVVGPLPAHITSISVSGTTLTINATSGADGGQFVLLESTNLLLPINQWTPILTNSFNGSGNLNLSTNIINPASPAEFYLLQMP